VILRYLAIGACDYFIFWNVNFYLLLFIFFAYRIQRTAFHIMLQICQCKDGSFKLWHFVIRIVFHGWILQINAQVNLRIYLHPNNKANCQHLQIIIIKFWPMDALIGWGSIWRVIQQMQLSRKVETARSCIQQE